MSRLQCVSASVTVSASARVEGMIRAPGIPPGSTLAVLGLAAILAASDDVAARQSAPIEVLRVQGNVYMLVGPGGNTAVQVGEDGVVVVDTQLDSTAEDVMAAIRSLSDGPVRYIIDTHLHPDHTGGNAAIARLGAVPPHPVAAIVGHENLLLRMAQPPAGEPPPVDVWPDSTYFTPFRDFFFNGEAVVLEHLPEAHTDGDTLVFFRRSDVLVTGDVFTPDRYPVIDLGNGGTVGGMLDGLNRILQLTVPARMQEGGTQVIPGHGRLSEEADVVEYRNMVTIVRDRIQSLIDQGMSLEGVQAARPTSDYDTEYGTEQADRFVEAVYRSLM